MRVIKNPQVLSLNFIPSKLIHRESLEKKIKDKISLGIGNLLIIGDPGSGKTISVKKVAEETKDIIFVEINCYTDNTFAAITRKIVSSLKGQPYSEYGKSRSQLSEDLVKVLDRKRKKSVVILFDEIDILIEKERSQQDILAPILNHFYGNIILISNKLEALKLLDKRIESRLGPEKIMVEKYNAKEIMDILEVRASEALEVASYNLETIARIARHVYHVSGDIREALRILLEVSQIAHERKIAINVDLVNEAIKRVEEVEFEQAFENLTLHEKIIIFGVANMTLSNSDGFVETKKVYGFYESETRRNGSNPVGERQFDNILKKLKLLGLLRTELRAVKSRQGRKSVVFPLFDSDRLVKIFSSKSDSNEMNANAQAGGGGV